MNNGLSLKQKDKIAKKIYKNYQRAQLDILYLNQHYNFYPKIDMFKVKETSPQYQKPDNAYLVQLEKKQELESFIGVIQQIQSHLSKETSFFMENEYLNFYDSNWWISYFSRASYYRLKHKSLDEFIELMCHFWSDEQIMSLIE